MSEWVSIKDRLPDARGESYLVMLVEDNKLECTSKHAVVVEFGAFTATPNSFTAYHDWECRCIVIDEDVTHWMPLPAPPKEQA